jgi:hypothetical protein
MNGITVSRPRSPLSARWRLRRRPRAHLIHIPKTGGTSLKAVLRPLTNAGPYELVFHHHHVRLENLPEGDKVYFVVRDPVARFVSGFNQRLRQGQPHFDNPWKPDEKIAFEFFSTPNALAEGLSSVDAQTYHRALWSMSVIIHLRDPYWHWFRNRDYMRKRAGDLLTIHWLPDLGDTFPLLVDQLGLPAETKLPSDHMASNRTPGQYNDKLSSVARFNLDRWYARDWSFVDFCSEFECFAGPSFSPDTLPSVWSQTAV